MTVFDVSQINYSLKAQQDPTMHAEGRSLYL